MLPLGGQDATVRLTAVAADRTGTIAATITYGPAMVTMVALAAVTLRRRASGTTAVAAAMWRSRQEIGRWPSLVTAVGLVLASGELPARPACWAPWCRGRR